MADSGKRAPEGGKVEEPRPAAGVAAAAPAGMVVTSGDATITWEANGSGKGRESTPRMSGPVYTLEAGTKATLLVRCYAQWGHGRQASWQERARLICGTI